ncbi:DNA alkylation repair protein, partial [Rhizobium leguminosarum]|uniref:DNA alkylation repair protein n=1 Tax=Rhizobium leguminosarum TaxID=384 RepID=UPI003F96A9CE
MCGGTGNHGEGGAPDKFTLVGGIVTGGALGISNPDIRAVARLAKKDQLRAIQIWRSDIREARLLALYTAEPKR